MGIPLPQIQVVTFDIQHAQLALGQAVQRFLGVGHPLLLHVVGLLALDHGRRQHAAAGDFGQHGFALGIEEGHGARLAIDHHLQAGRAQDHLVRVAGGLPALAHASLRYHRQGFALHEGVELVLGEGDPRDPVRKELNAQRPAGDRQGHAVGVAIGSFLHVAAGGQGTEAWHQQGKCEHSFSGMGVHGARSIWAPWICEMIK